jgi:16S rRNA (uracil1498-N3)-methyltransferase
MADRFYLNCPLVVGPIQLRGPDARHLSEVCRYRAGDQVYLFNGDGSQYLARIKSVHRRGVELEILSVESPPRELAVRLQVAAPLPKGDRTQFLIEKLTELGAAEFVPLTTKRSVIDPGEGKMEKLQRYAIEASKQCGRNVLLHIQPAANWAEFCKSSDLPATRLVAHPGGMSALDSTNEDSVLAVGPEGGFTPEEINLARESGWCVVDLGPRILRIETAAILLTSWAVRSAIGANMPRA